jgi:glycosyltransferase involved in cell wall biosynthesis
MSHGNKVHLVCHRAGPEFGNDQNSTLHLVPRPGGAFLFGGLLLARRGRQIVRRIIANSPAARVIVNGGNCNWPDINWVHCVHHAWHQKSGGGPAWFKLKQSFSHWLSCRNERSALSKTRLIIANSAQTRCDLIDYLGIEPDRIHVVYPGVDPQLCVSTATRRAVARGWLGKDEHQPLVCFVGALGYDSNKGFDTLFAAWQKLRTMADWDADLVVAGGGRAVNLWQRKIRAAGLEQRIRLLGFTNRVADVLAAVDLLVSPVRYESYGLNVQEAISCGVPAMVSESAGVAERYPADLRELLVRNPEDVDGLARKLLRWRPEMDRWKDRVRSFANTLRSYTLDDMARQIVSIVESENQVYHQRRAHGEGRRR